MLIQCDNVSTQMSWGRFFYFAASGFIWLTGSVVDGNQMGEKQFRELGDIKVLEAKNMLLRIAGFLFLLSPFIMSQVMELCCEIQVTQ